MEYVYKPHNGSERRAESWQAFLRIVHERAQEGRFAAMVDTRGKRLVIEEMATVKIQGMSGGEVVEPMKVDGVRWPPSESKGQGGRANWGLLAMVGMNLAVWSGIVYAVAKWLHMGQ